MFHKKKTFKKKHHLSPRTRELFAGDDFVFILLEPVFTSFTLLLLDLREPHFPLHND